jgi:hypothetical protein
LTIFNDKNKSFLFILSKQPQRNSANATFKITKHDLKAGGSVLTIKTVAQQCSAQASSKLVDISVKLENHLNTSVIALEAGQKPYKY